MHPFIGPALGLLLIALLVGTLDTTVRRGALTRNTSLGIRTSATLASDAAWAAGHRAASPYTRAAAIASAVLAVALLAAAFVVPADLTAVPVLAVVLTSYGITVGLLFAGTRVANRAARAATDDP